MCRARGRASATGRALLPSESPSSSERRPGLRRVGPRLFPGVAFAPALALPARDALARELPLLAPPPAPPPSTRFRTLTRVAELLGGEPMRALEFVGRGIDGDPIPGIHYQLGK